MKHAHWRGILAWCAPFCQRIAFVWTTSRGKRAEETSRPLSD